MESLIFGEFDCSVEFFCGVNRKVQACEGEGKQVAAFIRASCSSQGANDQNRA